jgi:hypothetical protein
VRCAWAKFKGLSPILTAGWGCIASYPINGIIYRPGPVTCVQSAFTALIFGNETWAMKKANLHSLERTGTVDGEMDVRGVEEG